MPTSLRNRTSFPVAFFASKIAPPADHLTVVVKGTFELLPGGPARALSKDEQLPLGGDVHLGNDPAAALLAPTDFAPVKPRVDVLVAPSPIAAAARARHAKQSLTLGAFEVARDTRRGRGFGPVSPRDAERASKLGTYDAAWLAGRWPWFPQDFDATYFQAAPRDQQVDGVVRGDEILALEGFSPEGRLVGALPGLRMRAFARRAGASGLELVEIALRLDTVSVDVERSTVAIVWRGAIPVASRRHEEIVEIVIASEDLATAPLPAELHCAEDDVSSREREEIRAAEDEAAARVDAAALAPAAPAPEDDEAAALADARATLEAGNASPALLAKLAGATRIDAFLAILRAEAPAVDDLAAERAHANALAAGAEQAKRCGIDPEAFDEAPDTESRPQAALVRMAREELVRRHEGGEAIGAVDLSGLDLSGLDLSGILLARCRLDGAVLRGACLDGADLEHASLEGASLAGASLVGATLERARLSGADLGEADLGEALLAFAVLRGTSLARASLMKADLTGAELTDADLSGADLSGALFADARLRGATLREATLEGASFRAADLSGAVLSKASAACASFAHAIVDEARFDGADLREACFGEARGSVVSFAAASLEGMRAAGASLPGLRATGARASGSIWTGAELGGACFARASLERADFTEATLEGATFRGATMREAVLSRALLAGAELSNVSLFRGVLDGADLTGADVSDSQLFECELFEAITTGAVFDRTDLGRTKLEVFQ